MPAPRARLTWWARAFARQCRDALDELTFLAPWTFSRASLDRLNEFPVIGEIPTLRQLAKFEVDLLPAIEDRLGLEVTSGESAWLDKLRRLITKASRLAGTRIAAIERLALQSGELARMEYDFLFDKARHLLAIGYNVASASAGPELLRSAGFGSEIFQFRGDCSGRVAAGELVCPGTSPHYRRGRIASPFVERVDVRIPHAAPGNADLRKHVARPDL